MNVTAVRIPCCMCGSLIFSNAANKCASCLASQHDLSWLIQQGRSVDGGDIVVYQCRECRRYQRSSTNDKSYEAMVPESPELLALCLKQIPALSPTANPKLHLVDAHWIWTEPNNMRFKVVLTVRYQVEQVPVQQRVKVELRNRWKQCPECNREYTNRTWHAVVQLRQFRASDESKTGLAVLELAIAKHAEVRKHVLKIDATKNGLDFYLLNLCQAQAFCHYLQRVHPLRVKTSTKLVSTDVKSNLANLKHSLTAELVPLCRHDLLLLPKSLPKVKFAGRLVLVEKLSSFFTLLDASPQRSASVGNAIMTLSAETYYKNEKLIRVLLTAKRFIRFVVLDVELLSSDHQNHNSSSSNNNNSSTNSTPIMQPLPIMQPQGSQTQPAATTKYALANALVARESDMGVNDITFQVVTHLGHWIQAGDVVLGYDLESAVVAGCGDWEFQTSLQNSFVIPDVILVKKLTTTAASRTKQAANKPINSFEEETATTPFEKNTTTKKREKRRIRREGKKTKELEESAMRMGFLEPSSGGDDDNQVDDADLMQRELLLSQDPEVQEELEQLESALADIGAVMMTTNTTITTNTTTTNTTTTTTALQNKKGDKDHPNDKDNDITTSNVNSNENGTTGETNTATDPTQPSPPPRQLNPREEEEEDDDFEPIVVLQTEM